MALNSPQADLPISLRGGADVWDEGAAGLILSSEFFVDSPVGTIYDVDCSELTDATEESGQSRVTETDTSQSSNSDHGSGVTLATESLVWELADSVGETLSAATAKLVLAEGVRNIEDVSQHELTNLVRVSEPAVFVDGFRLTETGMGQHYSSAGSTDTIKATGQMSFVYQVSAGRLLIFNPGFGGLAFTSDGTYDANNSEMSPTLLRSVSVTEPVSGYYRVSVDLAGYTNYVTFGVYTTSNQMSYLGDDVSNFYLADLKFTGQSAIPINDTSEKTRVRTVYAEGARALENIGLYGIIGLTKAPDTTLFSDGYALTEKATSGYHYSFASVGAGAKGIKGDCSVTFKVPPDRMFALTIGALFLLTSMGGGTLDTTSSNHTSLGVSVSLTPVGNGYYQIDMMNVGFASESPYLDVFFAMYTTTSFSSYLGSTSKSLNVGNIRFKASDLLAGVATPATAISSEAVSEGNSATDLEDYSWTAGSTNFDADQSDFAFGLDESTTLMLALLNEHAATTAIDLPAGQYSVVGDATETSAGNDTAVTTAVSIGSSNESGASDSVQTGAGSTTADGSADVTGGWSTVVTASVDTTGGAAATSTEDQIAQAAFVASEAEPAAGVDTPVGTYVTNSAEAENLSADAAQAVDSATYVAGQAAGMSSADQASTYSANTTTTETSPAVDLGVGIWTTSASDTASGAATNTQLGSATIPASEVESGTPDAAQSVATSTNSAGAAEATNDAASTAVSAMPVLGAASATSQDDSTLTPAWFAQTLQAVVASELVASTAQLYSSEAESITATELSDWSLYATIATSITQPTTSADAQSVLATTSVQGEATGTGTDTLGATQAVNSSGSDAATASSFQTTDSMVYVDGLGQGTAYDAQAVWIEAYLTHIETVSATHSNPSAMLATPQMLESLAAQGVPSTSYVAQSLLTEAATALDSSLAGFTLLATLSGAGVALADQSGENVGALLSVTEVITATSTQAGQWVFAGTAGEAVFAADLGEVSALFVVSEDEAGAAGELNEGSAMQFADVSEVLSALEQLVVDVFGPSTLTPELSRVLLEVAKSYVMRESAQVEVFLETLNSNVDVSIPKSQVDPHGDFVLIRSTPTSRVEVVVERTTCFKSNPSNSDAV